jgi:hypothetical protein
MTVAGHGGEGANLFEVLQNQLHVRLGAALVPSDPVIALGKPPLAMRADKAPLAQPVIQTPRAIAYVLNPLHPVVVDAGRLSLTVGAGMTRSGRMQRDLDAVLGFLHIYDLHVF